jgi:hypothetical protein
MVPKRQSAKAIEEHILIFSPVHNMTQSEELECFLKGYSDWERRWLEGFEEYQIAVRAGKMTTAMEIACAVLLSSSSVSEISRDVKRIFQQAFPELVD